MNFISGVVHEIMMCLDLIMYVSYVMLEFDIFQLIMCVDYIYLTLKFEFIMVVYYVRL